MRIGIGSVTAVALAGMACAGDVQLTQEQAARSICVMKTAPPPPVKYSIVKTFLFGKPAYGGVEPLTLRVVNMARQSYADAIINFYGGQRFGFWPWRVVRPVVRGDAVQILTPEVFDCRALGGKIYPGVGTVVESEYERGRREERERIQREGVGR